MTVYFQRLEQGLFETLSGSAAVVAWDKGEQPRADDELLSMSIRGGRSREVGRHAFKPVVSTELEVGAVTAGELAMVVLNQFAVRHSVQAGETPEDVRDVLLAGLSAVDPTLVTPTPSGTSRVLLTAETLGGLWSLATFGPVSEDEDEQIRSNDAVQLVKTREDFTLQLEAFSSSDGRGAHGILAEARKRLRSEAGSQTLHNWGVTMWQVGDVVDISAVAGARWESRAQLNIDCRMRAVSVEAVDPIESAGVTLTV